MRNKLFYELGNFARLSFCCFSKLPCFRPYLPKIRLRKGKTFRAGLKKDKSNPAPPPHPLKNLLSVTKVVFFLDVPLHTNYETIFQFVMVFNSSK